jgi:hypothetical protein
MVKDPEGPFGGAKIAITNGPEWGTVKNEQ